MADNAKDMMGQLEQIAQAEKLLQEAKSLMASDAWGKASARIMDLQDILRGVAKRGDKNITTDQKARQLLAEAKAMLTKMATVRKFSRPGAKDMMGTNKRIIRARGHEFLAEDEGNRTRISIKIDGAWEHATTVNSDNQTAAEWIEANAKPGDPSRWLPSAFSRPGSPDTFAVEDRFYFGKGRKER